ncbi:MAG TPA: outer membrane beta-barrel protein [Candidatus Saccharimonadales bacterium]|nr:outer membrane beta-barrel protein [Candidatus Saccharimonadales bacterium]
MQTWTKRISLFLTLFTAFSARAQQRYEITPFVGYESSASYPVSVFSTGGSGTVPVNRLRVDDSLAFGTMIDVGLTENSQFDFMWNRNNTSYDAHNVLTNSYFHAYDSDIDQFQFGALYMFRNSEVKLRPYIVGGIGFTHDSNSNSTPNRTEFSWSIGGGVKYFASRHIGFRADVRYLPTYGSSSNATYCDPFFGCYTTRVSNYLNRANIVGGIIFKF